MKMIILSFVALIVLGGGGAGAYFYFATPAAEAAGLEGEHEEAVKEVEHDPALYTYVELDPLILPIIDEYGVNQVVSLVLSLEVVNAEAAAKVESMKPRLNDAYIQNMYGLINQHVAHNKSGLIKVESLKKRLNKISENVMGKDVVNDVLLQVIQQRPI